MYEHVTEMHDATDTCEGLLSGSANEMDRGSPLPIPCWRAEATWTQAIILCICHAAWWRVGVSEDVAIVQELDNVVPLAAYDKAFCIAGFLCVQRLAAGLPSCLGHGRRTGHSMTGKCPGRGKVMAGRLACWRLRFCESTYDTDSSPMSVARVVYRTLSHLGLHKYSSPCGAPNQHQHT